MRALRDLSPSRARRLGDTTSTRGGRFRRGTALLSGFALVASLTAGALVSAPTSSEEAEQPQAEDLSLAFESTCIGYCKRPTNAAKVFRWGLEAWRDEFEVKRLGNHWKSTHPGMVNHQNGMLTINAGSRSGVVRAWPNNQAASYGRWEARVRAREFSTRGAKYKFIWELVPVDAQKRRCQTDGVVMSSYRTDDRAATGVVRGAGDRVFTYNRNRDLRSRAWHTYAVEVTPRNISWFVDTQVVHTERRDQALTGVKFRPQFRIQGKPGRTMRKSWMQMDWARYYTLKRDHAKSIKAPQMATKRHRARC